MNPEAMLASKVVETSWMKPLLTVERLVVSVPTRRGRDAAVRGISFSLQPNEALGIVGESGSGKSLSVLSIMGLLPTGIMRESGDIRFEGEELDGVSRERLRQIRRDRIGYIPQDPHTSLHPSFRIADQLIEGLWRSASARAELLERAVAILRAMGMPDVERVLWQYPHELSGGMKQRVMAAMALVRNPSLVVADEPTSALDVTVQAQFIHHLRGLRNTMDVAMIFISHDLGVVSGICDSIAVMYSGQIVEHGPTRRVIREPQHPYTRALLDSMPSSLDRHAMPERPPARPVCPSDDAK